MPIRPTRSGRRPLLSLVSCLTLVACAGDPHEPGSTLATARPMAAGTAQTRIGIDGAKFRINGAITYPGAAAEGKLINVRMVNSVFEDTKRSEFNPEGNTGEFVGQMSDYMSAGVKAFTVSLQGGFPGYEGAVNTAFLGNGAVKSGYLARVARVIDRADDLGATIILSLYYQRQDQHLANEAAIKAGVVNVTNWIRQQGYRNVILEIVNEYGHQGFNHSILRTDAGVASLVRLAKTKHPSLPVTASSVGNGQVTPRVAAASDLLLTHFNNLSTSTIASRLKTLTAAYPDKPIVCNEDDKTGSSAAAAAEASIKGGASHGLMLERLNQHYPFRFKGRDDDPIAYGRYRALSQD